MKKCFQQLDNALISRPGFGLTKSVGQTMLKTFCGTRAFLALEIPDAACSLGTGKYTNKVDVWGLGVILFKLLFGAKKPFSEKKTNTTAASASTTEQLTTFFEGKHRVGSLSFSIFLSLLFRNLPISPRRWENSTKIRKVQKSVSTLPPLEYFSVYVYYNKISKKLKLSFDLSVDLVRNISFICLLNPPDLIRKK